MFVTSDPLIKGSSFFSFYNYHFHLAALGVGYFIVLSGFLISWIILEEYKFTSAFDLKFFWIKRTLRIWPLYFLLILAGFILVWLSRHYLQSTVHDMPNFIWLITFTLNFYIIKYGPAFLFFIVFLWSISVEEQLYVVWGIVLKWLKQLFIPFCLVLLFGSIVFRIYAIDQPANLYFNTLNWVPHFTLGALIAYISINENKLFTQLKQLSKPVIVTIYILFILNLIFYNRIYTSVFMTIIQRLMDALFFAFFIFEQNFCENKLFNIGNSKGLSYLGKISYGLFCYHGLIILLFTKVLSQTTLLNNALFVFIIDPLLIFVVTLLVAAISYRYCEKPIMSLRYKFRSA